MSLATYADLKTAFTSWLGRSDLTGNYDDWVTLAEAVFNRKLRVRQQEATSNLTTSSGAATLPTDYLSWRRVTYQGSPLRELEYVTPDWFKANYASSPADLPSVFTIEGSTLYTMPYSDSAATQIEYFQKIAALSSTVNWLYTAHPDVYLAGGLAEGLGFVRDFEGFSFWKLRRDELLDEIQSLSNKTRGIGGMRVMGPTP